MYCPNCGLENERGAHFCANCGTTLAAAGGPAGGVPPVNPLPNQYPPSGPYPIPPPPGGNSTLKNSAIGCLVAILVIFFFGLSCTRACFHHRGGYMIHRY